MHGNELGLSLMKYGLWLVISASNEMEGGAHPTF